MKYRSIFYIFIVIVFIFNGFFLYVFANKVNSKRVNMAEELYIKAQKSDKKLVLLIESDILQPKDKIKMEIANIYLHLNNFYIANLYLKQIDDPSGIIKYAESALEEGNYSIFDKLSENIDNQKVNDELNSIKNFLMGNYDSIKGVEKNPLTDLGKAIITINNRDYANFNGEGVIAGLITNNQKLSTTTKELTISKSLIDMSQNNLAKYILDRIVIEKPEISTSYVLMAKINEQEREYNKAIINIKLAISKDPSISEYYKEGIRLAEISNNQIEKSYFENRLDALNNTIL